MELITLQELEALSPLFRGKGGHRLVRTLMHWLSIDKICELYDKSASYIGAEFAHHTIVEMGVDYLIGNVHRLKQLPHGAFVTISNHPYGSLDGLILADLFGNIRSDYKIVVNELLSRIKALNVSSIAVNPSGKTKADVSAQNMNGVKAILAHLHNDHPLGVFPSGAVSDLSLRDKCVRDRPWQENMIHIIQKMNVPIVPVRFFDGNSPFYYLLGLIDWRVRLLRLPSEVFNKDRHPQRMAIGEVISTEQLTQFSSTTDLCHFLRQSVYEMPLPVSFTNRSDLF